MKTREEIDQKFWKLGEVYDAITAKADAGEITQDKANRIHAQINGVRNGLNWVLGFAPIDTEEEINNGEI